MLSMSWDRTESRDERTYFGRKHFVVLFWFFSSVLIMSCGYSHPTYLLFSIADSHGSCLMLLQPTVLKWTGHLSSILMLGSGTRLTHKYFFWRPKKCLFSLIRQLIRRNAREMTKKGSCPDLVLYKPLTGFVYHVNCTKNNALKNSTCLCKCRPKRDGKLSHPIQCTLDQQTLTAHKSATGDISIAYN